MSGICDLDKVQFPGIQKRFKSLRTAALIIWFDFSKVDFELLNERLKLLPLRSGVNTAKSEELDFLWENWNDVVLSTIGSLRKNDDDGYENTTIGLMSKNNSSVRPARALCIFVHFFAVLVLATTCIDQL